MSEFIPNSEMIKTLSKEEIYDMYEKKHIENSDLKEKIRVLESKLELADKEADKFERLFNESKNINGL